MLRKVYLLPLASADGRRGRPADGRRGRLSAAPVSSVAPKKKHLIEAATFGRLDQMLSTIVYGGVWGFVSPPARGLGGSAPQPKFSMLGLGVLPGLGSD